MSTILTQGFLLTGLLCLLSLSTSAVSAEPAACSTGGAAGVTRLGLSIRRTPVEAATADYPRSRLPSPFLEVNIANIKYFADSRQVLAQASSRPGDAPGAAQPLGQHGRPEHQDDMTE
jgi:hypothetical protein